MVNDCISNNKRKKLMGTAGLFCKHWHNSQMNVGNSQQLVISEQHNSKRKIHDNDSAVSS